jgi:hypothetical protein
MTEFVIAIALLGVFILGILVALFWAAVKDGENGDG